MLARFRKDHDSELRAQHSQEWRVDTTHALSELARYIPYPGCVRHVFKLAIPVILGVLEDASILLPGLKLDLCVCEMSVEQIRWCLHGVRCEVMVTRSSRVKVV